MATVKSYLKGLSKPQLEQLLLELSARNPQVLDLLTITADPGKGKKVFDTYSDRLAECFEPPPEGVDLATAQLVLQDYSRVGNIGELAILLMDMAAMGAKYAHDFGEQSDDFFGVVAECFEQSLSMAAQLDMVSSFRVPADVVFGYLAGMDHPVGDDVRTIHALHFGSVPKPIKALRAKRSARKVKAPAPDKSKVLPIHGAAHGSNPFGTRAPEEVLCIESRAIETRMEGPVWLYLAMDAHTRFVFHQDIKRQSTLPDYFAFIAAVLKKRPELSSSTLALDTPPEMKSAFAKLLPKFKAVVCDQAKVKAVTEEFHTAFLAQLDGQGRDN